LRGRRLGAEIANGKPWAAGGDTGVSGVAEWGWPLTPRLEPDVAGQAGFLLRKATKPPVRHHNNGDLAPVDKVAASLSPGRREHRLGARGLHNRRFR
jgi:hypothetical protein